MNNHEPDQNKIFQHHHIIAKLKKEKAWKIIAMPLF